MVIPLLLGLLSGTGALLLVRGVRGRPDPLPIVVARLGRAGVSAAEARAANPSRAAGLRQAVVRYEMERITARRRRDLAAAGRSVEQHAVEKLTLALVLGALPIAIAVIGRVAGMGGTGRWTGAAALAGVAVGATLPEVMLRARAAARRDQFCHALSSYLDLVNVLLAGGAGVESALDAAADAGDGWSFGVIRDALVRGRLTRRSPWAVFGEVGEHLGIDAVVELAASLQLAGEQGARVRSSLAARAASLRAHQLARVEASAQSASERMGLPTVAMFLAFLVLLAYPAIERLANA